MFLKQYSKHQAGTEKKKKKRPQKTQLCVKIFVQVTLNFIPDTSYFPNFAKTDETRMNVSTHEIRTLEQIYNIKSFLLSQEEIPVFLYVNNTAITGITVAKIFLIEFSRKET